MADIVDLYRKHPHLLAVYFPTKEMAADCEHRAELGDDNAMLKLSLAYTLPLPKIVPYGEETEWRIEYTPIDSAVSDKWNDRAAKAYNFNAMFFAEAVALGCRTSTENSMGIRQRVIKGGQVTDTPFPRDTTIGKAYAEHYLKPLIQGHHVLPPETNYFSIKFDLPPAKGEYPEKLGKEEIRLAPTISSMFEPANSSTRVDTTVRLLYSRALLLSERKRSEGYGGVAESNTSAESIKSLHQQTDLRHIHALEQCAAAGDGYAARVLSKFYAQKHFNEYATKTRLFGPPDYMPNKHYNSVTAKHWEIIADSLEGKGTAIERDKFLKKVIYSQDNTPEGLYNIGYALFHNEHIGDKAKGLDYLKHAANLGDANAARELGEIFHNKFDEKGDKTDLSLAHFWYKIAATTPMKVKDSEGKVTEYDGHPNAKARVAYLEKAYPELQAAVLNENALRNPSPAHIRQYPASAFHIEIPITDISNLIRNPEHGGIVTRMEHAVAAIDDHVKEFEAMTTGIQAKIDELGARQLVMDGRIDHLSGEELSALRGNDKISEQQRVHERLQQLSHNRWVKETISNLGSSVAMAIAVPYLAPLLPGKLALDLANFHGTTMLLSNTARAKGYQSVMQNEVENQQAIIDELESRKIDTSKFPDEIRELAMEVQRLSDSGPMQRLKKDEVRSRAIIEGCLRQRILKSGLEVSRSLERYAQREGDFDSLDTMLEQFKAMDEHLYTALNNLCYGHANSKDMEVILQDVHAMKGDDLPPHEKALKRYVERVMKGDIANFMTRASQIDVIEDCKLIDFNTMNVDHSVATADLVKGNAAESAEDQGKRQVENATKLALTCMFSQQFGVTHIGQYDVKRVFSFFLHRHGRKQLIADELQDGQVSMEELPKRVTAKSNEQMEGFVERATKRAHNRQKEDEIPHIGDLFLRTCGYEYYLPQAVITSGRGNRFADNPESPVAYPMVNEVIQNFIQKLSLKDHATYQQQVGAELDNIIAQSFIDFFRQLGKKHNSEFAHEREYLRDAYEHEMYKSRFITYQDDITADAVSQFPMFLQVYERNLKKALTVAPEAEAATIEHQIASLDANAQQHLAPNFAKPGSHQAREEARKLDHRGANMTESWRFAG
jgi:TPR repeat protein